MARVRAEILRDGELVVAGVSARLDEGSRGWYGEFEDLALPTAERLLGSKKPVEIRFEDGRSGEALITMIDVGTGEVTFQGTSPLR